MTQAIHTALERQIHPKPIPVQIKTPEEEWGLRYDYFLIVLYMEYSSALPRLINMLSDLQTLMLMGKCVGAHPV